MSMQVTQTTIQHNSQIIARKADQAYTQQASARPQQDQQVSETANVSVLQLTHIMRSRAELAALQLASGRLMGDMSSVQALTDGVREIQGIVQQLSELSNRASQSSSEQALTQLQSEVARLGQRISQVLARHTPGSDFEMPIEISSAADEDTDNAPERPIGELFALAIKPELEEILSNLDVSTPQNAEQSVDDLNALKQRLDEFLEELAMAQKMMSGAQDGEASGLMASSKQAMKLAAQLHESLLSQPDIASIAQANMMSGQIRVETVR